MLRELNEIVSREKELFKKLKQIENLNGRIAMGGLVYLLFTKLVSSRINIIDQLRSNLISKIRHYFFIHISFNIIII